MAIAVSLMNAMVFPELMLTTIDDEEFALWVELLGRRIGLRDTAIRKANLKQCVETRLRKRGIASRRAYFDLLRAQTGNDDEWDSFIDLLPLHETRFMRHASSLNLLTGYIQQRCAVKKNCPTMLTAWSAGCSTGEEVYSLAIVMDQAVAPNEPRPGINVIGSDLSRNSLNTARQGSYHRRALTNLSALQIAQYFDQTDNDRFVVKAGLRERTQFLPVNLRELDASNGMVGPVDIVFCQNVLIYFDNAERERIVNQLAEHVAPGGVLVLGGGELLRWNRPDFKRIATDDTLAYKKLSLL
jgi:chemotaxis methyl-accepting protein methylase